ncbi:2,4'-dihydroxyacetophenone dioxygenase family protein [Haliea salexigens]|uniref:2,4'-dihydroxyacetophenone dioxygenase family protein n=1 Tax=Haliea salexigens TaxID=287487 RepID=UPI00048179C2|nr:2,4'-dihydroxyacetophenone dioxygenase family protein [Haliea salexigens]
MSKSHPILRTLKQDRSAFFDPDTLPWTPWGMPGTYFKLLNIDEVSGRFTFLLKVDPGVSAPIHKHVGAAEGFILEGAFHYPDDAGSAGDYVFECAGALHIPETPDGLTMLAIAHGPIVGYEDDGAIAGLIDWQWMMETARANGAADHIHLHNTFTEVE